MLTRAIEYDVLPTCLRHGMGVMAYSPLAGGWLSGEHRKGQQVSGRGSAARAQRFPGRYDASDPSNAAELAAADALGALADEAGLTLTQMAVVLATWPPLRVTSAYSIGPRTTEDLDSYLAADGIDFEAKRCWTASTNLGPVVTMNVAFRRCGKWRMSSAAAHLSPPLRQAEGSSHPGHVLRRREGVPGLPQ